MALGRITAGIVKINAVTTVQDANPVSQHYGKQNPRGSQQYHILVQCQVHIHWVLVVLEMSNVAHFHIRLFLFLVVDWNLSSMSILPLTFQVRYLPGNIFLADFLRLIFSLQVTIESFAPGICLYFFYKIVCFSSLTALLPKFEHLLNKTIHSFYLLILTLRWTPDEMKT